MSMINVSGLTVLVGLVMQNDFLIISRLLCCLQACDLLCECAAHSVTPSPPHTEISSLIVFSFFFYCQIVSLYQL